MGRCGHDTARMTCLLTVCALGVVLVVGAVPAGAASSPQTCVVDASNGGLAGLQGVLINGHCYAVPRSAGDQDGGTPGGPQYRSVICAQPAGSGSGPAITNCIAPSTCPDGVAWQTEINSGNGWQPV